MPTNRGSTVTNVHRRRAHALQRMRNWDDRRKAFRARFGEKLGPMNVFSKAHRYMIDYFYMREKRQAEELSTESQKRALAARRERGEAEDLLILDPPQADLSLRP